MLEKATKKEEILNESDFKVVKIEDDAVIVNVDGWRMRVYFDKATKKDDIYVGKSISVKHYGELKDPHSIRFEKL